MCTLNCPIGGYDYIAVGYDPYVANSYNLFRWAQQVISNNNFGDPTADPQVYTSVGDSNQPPAFCADDSPDPGTPALPDGSQSYYLGEAEEIHTNAGGVGQVRFELTDGNDQFKVIITFLRATPLTQAEMTSPSGPCDLVVSNWDSVTFTVQKPDGTTVQTGVIACFQLRTCNRNYLYSCQTDCTAALNGPTCNTPSASESFLPAGVSRSPSPSAFVFQTSVSNSPSPMSSTPSVSTSPGAQGGGPGVQTGSGAGLSSWLEFGLIV